jgi:DNA polymerase-3 subunit beta
MEFVIKQSVLKEELGFVQGIVEKKNTIPVLSNILIESVGESTLRIIGTDLDVTIRCEAEAAITTPGAMCIQARKLFDIVRLLPDADIKFKKEDNDWVKVDCLKSNFRLAGVARDQFPEVPSFKSAPMKLPAKVMQYFVSHTAFAITQEQSRFTLSGAKFIVGEGTVKMITTDGHRLAYIEKNNLGEAAPDGTMDCLIPKKALVELVRISSDPENSISFGEDENHIYFEAEGRLLITRKLSGTFPNYEMVIPKGNDKTTVFDCEDMKSALARVSLMADDRNRAVRMTFKENEIQLSAQTAEEGEAVETIPADYSGEEVQIGFNSRYLQEFLAVATGEGESSAPTSVAAEGDKETAGDKVLVKDGRARISFEFKDANGQTQMKIAGETGYDYKYVVMPLRI